MRYEATTDIKASAEAVWEIITNPQTLTEGGLGISRFEGALGLGEKVKLWAEVAPKQAFALKVTAYDPAARMEWTGGMPFGLFKGVRQFVLTPRGQGTHLLVTETFSGPMLGMIAKSMPDLQPSFDQFVDGVKRLAEKRR